MIRFELNGRPVEIAVAPTTTLLWWLRGEGLCGTKEGCAEGDCGACTVVVREPGGTLRSVNSCLQLVPALHGLQVWTVEGLEDDGLHPAQQAMVQALGSQCGYCTPGFVMSLAEGCHRQDMSDADKDDQLCGNLCRCTGYRPIRDALDQVAGSCPDDVLSRAQDTGTARELQLEYDGEVFVQPTSIDALWDALDAHPDHRLIAGTTDVGLEVTKRGSRWPALVSLEALPLAGCGETDDGFVLGAMTRLTDLEAWSRDALPVLAKMLRYFASRPIKHRATVGGNLCNASPIGDLAPVFMALDAQLVVASRGGERLVPIDDFFLSYRQTALRPGEILAGVRIPRPDAATHLGAFKVSKRRELDISAVCAGFAVHVQDGQVAWARLAYGGMAATTRRAEGVERALVGKPWTEASVRNALEQLDFQPLSDHRGSAWYRDTVARNLLVAFQAETSP